MRFSIKKKIIYTVIFNFLCLTALLVFVSIVCISDVLDDDSSQIMQLECSESVQEINEELRNIEQSVSMMSSFLTSSLGEHDELLLNKKRFDIYMKMMRELGRNAVMNTHGSLGAYLRFDPDVTDEGDFFWVKDSVTGDVADTQLTDIKAYDKSDFEHVGWFYTPLEAGEPIWLDPYYNKNIGYEMISYIVPLYKPNGDRLGIIGMDININLISELCADVSAYENGESFVIVKNGDVICENGYFKDGYAELEQSGCYYGAPTGTMITSDRNGRQMLIMSMMLDNNMQFFIRVPKAEVTAPKRKLITLLLLNAGVFLIISAVIVLRWAAKFTRPLLELTEKAQKIADNKLETELSCKTGDEVEVLSESLAKMVGSLKGHIDYINGLAYIEPMTRLGNNLAYKKKLEELSADIAEGKAGFTIFVMDLNGLKKVNDSYGHEKGDIYIKNSAKVISETFGGENCFRIGGDEFTAVLGSRSDEEINALAEQLNSAMSDFNRGKTEIYDQVHIAVGGSSYRKDEDGDTSDVFRRADSAMYEDKNRKEAKTEKVEKE